MHADFNADWYTSPRATARVCCSTGHRISTACHSLSDAERDRTGTQKAKDWDRLEIFYKIYRVEAPKVHTLKLRQGAGVIYDEDRLMLQLVYSVAEHWVDASIIRWLFPKFRGTVPPYSSCSLRYGNNKSELPRGRVPTGPI